MRWGDLSTEDKYDEDARLPQKHEQKKQEPEKKALAKTVYEMSKRGRRKQASATQPARIVNPDGERTCYPADIWELFAHRQGSQSPS